MSAMWRNFVAAWAHAISSIFINSGVLNLGEGAKFNCKTEMMYKKPDFANSTEKVNDSSLQDSWL
jgi:hypothetical protein